MVRITAYITLTEEEAAQFKDDADLESSLAARLDEMYTTDGGVVRPKLLGVDVEGGE